MDCARGNLPKSWSKTMSKNSQRRRRTYAQRKALSFHQDAPSPLAQLVADRQGYSVDEACRIIGCGKTLLYQLIRERRLVARKLCGRTLILRGDLQDFLASLPHAA